MDPMSYWRRTEEESEIPIIYISPLQVECRKPEYPGSYIVEISNKDETKFSNEAIVLTYDKICYTCDFETEKCSQKVRQ